MNCKNCGSLLTPGAKNCSICGCDVESTVATNNQATNPNIAVPTFGENQSTQPPLTNETNGFNISNQAVLNQQASVANNQSTPVASPVSPVQPTIPTNNPFLTNQAYVDTTQASVDTTQNEVPTATQVSQEASVNISPSSNQSFSVEGESNNGGVGNLGINNPANQEVNLQSTPMSNSSDVSQPSVQVGQPMANIQVQNGSDNGQISVEGSSVVENPVVSQASLEEVSKKPKKKVNIGLIIIIVLVIAIVAFFVFQYISLTNEANKIKNNTTNNNQLNNKANSVVSEDAYETIGHQDANYVEYDFDFNAINEIYEHEYTIGNHKVKMSITSDKTGGISINDNKQEISYPIVKIYHLLKSDTLFIENQLLANNSELYVYSGNSIENIKTNLKGSQFIQDIVIKDNTLEFTSVFWNENSVFNGDTSFNLCQDGFINHVSEDFAVEATYTFDLQESAYSSDKLAATTKKTVKQLYDESCSVTTTPTVPTTDPTVQTTNPVTSVDEQTPQIETIAPVTE